jgi:hypothetical protein
MGELRTLRQNVESSLMLASELEEVARQLRMGEREATHAVLILDNRQGFAGGAMTLKALGANCPPYYQLGLVTHAQAALVDEIQGS